MTAGATNQPRVQQVTRFDPTADTMLADLRAGLCPLCARTYRQEIWPDAGPVAVCTPPPLDVGWQLDATGPTPVVVKYDRPTQEGTHDATVKG